MKLVLSPLYLKVLGGGIPQLSHRCATKGSTLANSPLLSVGGWGKAPLMARTI